MQERPLVSAVITTHNRRELLKRAIESVLTQSYKNIECIVVSDNSTDGTNEYCSSRDDITFIPIPAEESHGGNYARNLGIKAAKGEYVAFLDDDDYWLPTKIEKQIEVCSDRDCMVVHCGKKLEYVNKDDVRYEDWLPNEKFLGDIKKKILQTCCVNTSSAFLIKKEVLYEVGLFDENLAFWQDYELTIRLAQKTEFYYVPECLFVYRVDTNDRGRLTNKYKPWIAAVEYIFNKHKDLYTQLSDTEFIQVLNLVWGDARNRAQAANLNDKVRMYQVLLTENSLLCSYGIRNIRSWFRFSLMCTIIYYVKHHKIVIDNKLIYLLTRISVGEYLYRIASACKKGL